MSTDAAPPPTFDVKRLISQLRVRDPTALAQAYALTFGTELGRLVLADHLMEMGFGLPITAETDAQLREAVGRYNAAIHLAEKASFGQPELVAALLAGNLEGKTDETPRDQPPAALYDEHDHE